MQLFGAQADVAGGGSAVSLFQFSERARRVARGQRFARFGYNLVDSVRASAARRAAGLPSILPPPGPQSEPPL